MRRFSFAMTGLLAGVMAAAALASAAVAGPPAPSVADWTITIGAEVRVMPTFEGSNSSMLRPFPLFDVHRADKPANFRSPRDGFSFGILDYGRFSAGPTTKVKFARKEGDDTTTLRGLGDVSWAFEAGVFADYWVTDWLRTRVELRQGFGGHHGVVGEATADLVVPVTKKLTLSGGPRLTAASAAATDPYFSITAAQAAASGLPIYSAGGGLRSLGAGAQATYEWSPQWSTHMFVEYEHLTGAAANSPLVIQRGTRDQIQVGMGATYSFNMKPLW